MGLVLLFGTSLCFGEAAPIPYILPPCPAGCEVRVYGPLEPVDIGLPEEAVRNADWKGYFISVGLAFDKGGFAYYHTPTHTLIIATTHSDFSLIETSMREN